MTLEQLRARLKELIDEARALVGLAETEKRDLTDEDQTRLDEITAEADETKSEIDKLERAEARKAKLASYDNYLSRPQEQRSQPTEPGRAPIIRDERERIPANVRRCRVRNFKGPDAELRAYRFGQFILAAAGNPNARNYCNEHGIELRLHSSGTNTAGGYLIDQEFDSDLIDLQEQYGVARQWANVKPMTSDTLTRRRRTGGLTAYAVGDGTAITESTAAWDAVNLVARTWGVISTITNELNEDASISIGDALIREIAVAFANKEDDALFNGDGTSTYHGIVGARSALTNLSGTIANIAGLYVGTGNAYSELTLEDFNSVVGKLPQYADGPNTAWFVHRTFFASVMQKLEYAGGGNTATDIAGRTGMSFLGYPVVVSQVMPKTEANSQVCALFGDMALAADFGDRRQSTIAFSDSATVNSVSVFETNEIALRGTERFDINVHDVGNADGTAANRVEGPIVGLITAAS